MRFHNSFLLVVFTFLLLPELIFCQFYPAKTYSTAEGMPSNSVYSIAQSDNMVMWFLTAQGVATYDASDWYLFPDSLELPITKHSYLKKDIKGDIWAIGYNKDSFLINYYSENKWHSIKKPDDWPDEPSSFSLEIMPGKVILARNHLVYIYSNNNKLWKKLEIESKGNFQVNSLNYINGLLYIATTEGFYTYQDNEIKYSDLNTSIGAMKDVLSINSFNSSLYVLEFNRIGKITNGNYELISNDLGIFSKSPFNKYSLEIDNRGRIFYSSFSKASILDEKTGLSRALQIKGREKNILSNQIFIDKENNIWVGDDRGLFKFNLLRFQNYNSDTGLIEDEVSSIYETRDGTLLIGNPRALNILKDGYLSSIDLGNEFSEYTTRILDIEQTPEGKIYLALGDGIAIYEDGKVRRIKKGTFKRNVNSLALYNNDLVFSESNKVYRMDAKGEISDFIDHPIIRNIIPFSSESLVLLGVEGVVITNGKEKKIFKGAYSLINNTYDIISWGKDTLVATSAGVAMLRGSKLIEYEALESIKTPIYSLLIDSNKNLWLGTSDGIKKWDGNKIISFNTGNGLSGNEVNRNALIEDKEHRIWIGTDEGVSVFDQNEDITFNYVPNVEVTSFQNLQGGDISSESAKRIPYSNNNIGINFRAISLFNEKGISLRYRLEGLEENWTIAEGRSKILVKYTNLDPREYKFLVQGRVESGGWSDPTQLNFEIQKPFYVTIWFALSCIAVLFLILYTVYRLRVRFLMDRQVKLKKLVALRTEEIDMQNSNLREAYRDLERAQLKLLQTEKMAALGTLTAGVAHEINNPLNYIKLGKEAIKQLSKEINDKIVIENKDIFYKVIEGIDLGVDKIVTITKSLGTFTKSDNRIDRKVKVNKVIQESLIILNHEFEDRISITGNYNSIDSFIVGNEGKLYQVCSNVIANSIQAIKNNGIIQINVIELDEYVLIEVEDDGIGMTEKVLSKIYDPFFTTKDQGEGTGLGLTTVYNIVKELGGLIDITSDVDKGTKVKIELRKYKINGKD